MVICDVAWEMVVRLCERGVYQIGRYVKEEKGRVVGWVRNYATAPWELDLGHHRRVVFAIASPQVNGPGFKILSLLV